MSQVIDTLKIDGKAKFNVNQMCFYYFKLIVQILKPIKTKEDEVKIELKNINEFFESESGELVQAKIEERSQILR